MSRARVFTVFHQERSDGQRRCGVARIVNGLPQRATGARWTYRNALTRATFAEFELSYQLARDLGMPVGAIEARALLSVPQQSLAALPARKIASAAGWS